MRPLSCLLLIGCVAASFSFSVSLKAQTMKPETTLEMLMQDETVKLDRFSSSFLSHIPPTELVLSLQEMKHAYGAFHDVVPSQEGFVLRFAQADVPAQITLDQNGQINTLWFGNPSMKGDLSIYVDDIKSLPGRTSLLIVSDGKPIVAHHADQALAVASAAKLAILLALKDAVQRGNLTWERVVTLNQNQRSVPSGQLQNWPDGTPITIATLAHLMMSISDNTATDTLIHLLGREAIEAVSPRNTPFLTTRETFILQSPAHAADRTAWTKGDIAQRRAILDKIAKSPLPENDNPDPLTNHEVEWFFSARELCGLLDKTAELPSLAIDTGLADRKDWHAIAFKGGSDAGVINLSSRVVDRNEHVHCVIATWNHNDALDHNKLLLPYRGILSALAAQK